MEEFKLQKLKQLFKPAPNSTKEDNGKVTIIGGSDLFHGAPILALKTASRIVDMVFFSSPELSVGRVAEKLKSRLASFIWVSFAEVDDYIQKSDAVLIGPGFMRGQKESKEITERLLKKFPNKQWVIDAGSLQVMGKQYIPKEAILTPNRKEYAMLFQDEKPEVMAKKYNCIIVLKLVGTIICSPKKCLLVKGGNAGLTKGGTGDILAGLTVALAAKNPPFLAAQAASFIVKKAADELYQKVGFAYNADDLAEKIPEVLGEYWKKNENKKI